MKGKEGEDNDAYINLNPFLSSDFLHDTNRQLEKIILFSIVLSLYPWKVGGSIHQWAKLIGFLYPDTFLGGEW